MRLDRSVGRATVAAKGVAIRTITLIIGGSCIAFAATDPPGTPAAVDSTGSNPSIEVVRLKALLEAQQKQLDQQSQEIEKLRGALDLDRQMLEKLSAAVSAPFSGRSRGGLMASSVPALPPPVSTSPIAPL